MTAAREKQLQDLLVYLRRANESMADARDLLFGMDDVGYLAGEVAAVKSALAVVITQASRQRHREFPR